MRGHFANVSMLSAISFDIRDPAYESFQKANDSLPVLYRKVPGSQYGVEGVFYTRLHQRSENIEGEIARRQIRWRRQHRRIDRSPRQCIHSHGLVAYL